MVCNKMSFDDKSQIRHIFKGSQPRAYLCGKCGKYHVTSQSKSESRIIRNNQRKKQKEFIPHEYYYDICSRQYSELFGKHLSKPMYFGIVNSEYKYRKKSSETIDGKTVHRFFGVLGAWKLNGKWPAFIASA